MSLSIVKDAAREKNMRSERGAALFVRDSFCHYVLTFAQIMYPVAVN